MLVVAFITFVWKLPLKDSLQSKGSEALGLAEEDEVVSAGVFVDTELVGRAGFVDIELWGRSGQL